MAWFLIGFCTGTLLTSYLFVGADRARRRKVSKNNAADGADRWKHQRPLPPI